MVGMTKIRDVAAGRLSAAEYAENFADVHRPLSPANALVEADRCYFCYDAPCIDACPTGIDIPGFIRKIKTNNLTGAGMDILSANIFGGSCARVCPTEILCEEACVRTAQEEKPVTIGLLQRYATDGIVNGGTHPFTRGPDSGFRIAVVGAGPAGLACAHALAVQGHAVTVFEANDKPGGLNEFGIAAYKLPDRFARREVDFILAIGGIEIEYGRELGKDLHLHDLRAAHDAVFIAVGQSGVRALGLAEENAEGVANAVDYIADLRRAENLSNLSVGRRIVVIGGGNTAIDIAVQSRRLGAEDVTIAYRRGPQQMSATAHEQDFAKSDGVRIRHWLQPQQILTQAGEVTGVRFKRENETLDLPADVVFKAIGQCLDPTPLDTDGLTVEDGRIAVDEDMRTSLPDVWAGGDCVKGEDLTVQAVQDGKIAADAIGGMLETN
jgi:glutamate synthase (NADPH/NADH) small chain